MPYEENEWTQRDGTTILIKDMSTEHIKNSIAMLDRRFIEVQNNVPYPNFHGEMAQYCAEQEYDAFMSRGPADVFPAYFELEEELIKRE